LVRESRDRLTGAPVRELAYGKPDRILHFDMGRAGCPLWQRVGRNSVRTDDPNGNFPISEVAVATTITPANGLANTGDLSMPVRVNSSTARSRSASMFGAMSCVI
jgi:hypothetical protein